VVTGRLGRRLEATGRSGSDSDSASSLASEIKDHESHKGSFAGPPRSLIRYLGTYCELELDPTKPRVLGLRSRTARSGSSAANPLESYGPLGMHEIGRRDTRSTVANGRTEFRWFIGGESNPQQWLRTIVNGRGVPGRR
jgi:hypothetical protein